MSFMMFCCLICVVLNSCVVRFLFFCVIIVLIVRLVCSLVMIWIVGCCSWMFIFVI